MNKKYFVPLLVVSGFFVAFAALAQSVDLGVSDPGILPTSRLYFLKEMGRGVRLFFTFNPVKKADLELDITNEKAAEAQKVEENSPKNEEAVRRAVENYQEASQKLKARLESLKENSQNPNIDKLLDKLADRTVKHEKLFDELEKKFEGNADLKKLTDDAKDALEGAAAKAAEKDDPSKFAARFEKALTESKGGELKHLQSVDILDRISDKAPDKLKKELENLRQDFTDRLQKDFEEFTKKVDEKTFQDTVRDLPGDVARRAVIIEELKRKADRRVYDALEKVGDFLDDVLKERKEANHEALRQIKEAEEKISELHKKISEGKSVSNVARNLLSEAEGHLKRAKAAYEAGKFGEAFGQARSAEVLARNGQRMLDDADDDSEDLREDLGNLEKKIHQYALILSERKITRESNVKAHALLENAKQHLGFARDALAKGDTAAIKTHIGHIRGFLSDLARIIEKLVDSTEQNRIVCTQEFKPVCGADGKTYSNACHAKVAGMAMKHEGECLATSAIKPVEPAPLPTTVAPTPVFRDELMNVSVTIDESGNFNPQEVKIQKGGKVTWVNKSQRQVWPASDVHPTHQAYPGFDALRGLSSGESYSFVFEKIGSWTYHNHLNPGMKGVAQVVE